LSIFGDVTSFQVHNDSSLVEISGRVLIGSFYLKTDMETYLPELPNVI